MKQLFSKIILLIIGCTTTTLLMVSCNPETPVLSHIIIESEAIPVHVNKELYGLNIEEINHAVEGGIYAELIQNRSFEDGIPPLNSAYDYSRNILTTPNNYSIPFIKPDSIPGWKVFSTNTYMITNKRDSANRRNQRSLFVSVNSGKGGVVAEGYKGIPLYKNESYDLSFYARSSSMKPLTLDITLADSTGNNPLSNLYQPRLTNEWKRYKYTFIAQEDTENGVLTFLTDSGTFHLDVVSLFPQKTWNEHKNGLRPDLMEMIVKLKPRFIRFPGGSFVEGYTTGTYPIWRETVGDIAERKHFWNIWGYGSSNGMGFHEYLQMCEDLGSEPVYVINSGITSQSRRPRYEPILSMDELIKDALDAIAYANQPKDSVLGAMRAKNGHPDPFHLKCIEIGSENYGPEYAKRFELFYNAIRDLYPNMIVISSSPVSEYNLNNWSDTHIYSGKTFFMSSDNRLEENKSQKHSSLSLIGEFGTTDSSHRTLGAAIGEACFFIGIEKHPSVIKRIAYSPVLGNVNFENQRPPMISFKQKQIVVTPSYHLWEMFNNHRGDELLQTTTDSYKRPQVVSGQVAIEVPNNDFIFKNVSINNLPISETSRLNGSWKTDSNYLYPVSENKNALLLGETNKYNYEFSTLVKRIKGNSPVEFHVRDNGSRQEQSDYICVTLNSEEVQISHQIGNIKDTLATSIPFSLENDQWYEIKLVCEDEIIQCFIDGLLIQEIQMPPIPSLLSVATLDRESNQIYLKVVNTTQHEEKTQFHLKNFSVHNNAEVIELSGNPEAKNTFEAPNTIHPVKKNISFSLGGSLIYTFPPNSITILKLRIND